MKNRAINYNNHNCLICKKQNKVYLCKNRRSLGNHLSRAHKPYSIKTYTLEFYFNNEIPKCICGCNQDVSWHKLKYKFNDYISGHNYKFSTKNQPILTNKQKKDARKKTIKTTKEKYGEDFHLKASRKALNKKIKEKKFNLLKEDKKCCICGISLKDDEDVKNHIVFVHSIKIEDYVLISFYEGKKPSCAKCPQETRFNKKYRYNKYCIEHANEARKEWALKNEKKASIKRKPKLILSLEEFNKRKEIILEKHNLVINSSYKEFKEKGVKTLLNVKCNICQTYQEKNLWYMMTDDCSCIKCKKVSSSSKRENEVADFIEQLGETIIRNDRKVIKPKELDILIPNKKFALEYHGLFFHSRMLEFAFSEAKYDNNHIMNKTNMCEIQGVNLFHIFDDEWINKKEILKSMIKHKLNKTERKIWARKTKVVEIDKDVGKIFFDQNHISGNSRGFKKCFGLKYENEIVSMISFGAPMHKKTYNEHIEIKRFCNKLNTTVVGGFSKLLKYSIQNWIKKEGYKKILSYADLRFGGIGEVYLKNNFKKLKKTNKPNFWYTNGKIRIDRLKYSKSKDAEEDGFFEIGGCKSIVYELLI